MGVLGLWVGVLRVIFGAAARCEWGVLPRNSAVFSLGEGAARRFSARRTVAGSQGEKIFKKGGGKSKIGGSRGAGRWRGATLYRARGGSFWVRRLGLWQRC